MSVTLRVEQHEVNGGHREWELAPDPSSIDAAIGSLREAWSATLWVRSDMQELAVSFSRGLIAILLIAGPDDFYDLDAEEPLPGRIAFAHGGQEAEHPRRHCVPLPEARAWLAKFLICGSLSPEGSRWERQGDQPRA